MENQNTQEIVTVDKVQEVIDNSGVPFEIDITELFSLSERAKAITSVEDPQFAIVKKEMQQKRTYLKDYMLRARDGFKKQADGVRDVEKQLLAEFVPEEERLIALDKAEKERVIKETRLEALPAKRERITTAGIEFTDEEILSLADADFEIEYNVRLGAKLEADRAADEERRVAEQAKIDADRAEIQRQKDEADRVEKARQEEREKAEEVLKLAKETAEREAKEAADRIEREKAEAEAKRVADEKERVERIEREKKEAEEKAEREKKEAEEKEAKRQADEKYQAFLKENNYDENNDMIIKTEDGASQIYRFVAEFSE